MAVCSVAVPAATIPVPAYVEDKGQRLSGVETGRYKGPFGATAGEFKLDIARV
jgi:hypothetical protein